MRKPAAMVDRIWMGRLLSARKDLSRWLTRCLVSNGRGRVFAFIIDVLSRVC